MGYHLSARIFQRQEATKPELTCAMTSKEKYQIMVEWKGLRLVPRKVVSIVRLAMCQIYLERYFCRRSSAWVWETPS